MKNYENKFELDVTNEPEISGELPTPLSADADAWESLKDVPFAGDQKERASIGRSETTDEIPEDSVLDINLFGKEEKSAVMSDIQEDTEVGFDSLSSDTDINGYPDEIPEDVSPETQDINDVEEWIGEINPNFDEFDVDSPYSNNCGSCALAVFERLEGDQDACATAQNIGYNSEMEAITGMEQVSMSPEEIENRLLAQGDGAHAIIGIDRAEGAGHWFNAACIDGKVVAIDGQNGTVQDWPPDYGDVVNWEMSV